MSSTGVAFPCESSCMRYVGARDDAERGILKLRDIWVKDFAKKVTSYN